ncbi:MAG: hypothetical protein Q8L86_18725 [Vicinamibacterales bacterium]|nr:hypothetical protein [Vicinamibacterales bacterium]
MRKDDIVVDNTNDMFGNVRCAMIMERIGRADDGGPGLLPTREDMLEEGDERGSARVQSAGRCGREAGVGSGAERAWGQVLEASSMKIRRSRRL